MNLLKHLGFLLSIFCSISISAQVIDNFSDGDLANNPSWSGDLKEFSVTGLGQLQLNNTIAGSSYLSVPFKVSSLSGSEWQINVRQVFSPSNSNRSRIYLVSDQANLESSLTGYYLELGENLSADVVTLFKQIGNTRTSLARGTTNISTAFNIDIKVTRDSESVWSLFVKSVTDTNFSVAEATVVDSSVKTSRYFGLVCIYTVSNSKNFYFDNITVVSPPDVVSPSVVGINALNANTLELVFSEPMLGESTTFLGNYLINNSIGNPTSVFLVNDSKITLSFTNSFSGSNTISITGLNDWSANEIANTILEFPFTTTVVSNPVTNTGNTLNYRDITINELMADINPIPNILPAVEYIELLNNTNQTTNLFGDTLIDGNVKRPFTKNFTIAGNGFALLVNNENSKNQLLSQFPTLNIYTLSSLGLTDGGESLMLKDASGKLIDYVNYKTSWYKDTDKNDGGYALEQINPKNPCSGEANWKATTDEKGGTPGFPNSVFSEQNEAPKIKNVTTKNAFQLEIVFNQPMDTLSFKAADYKIENGLTAYLPVPYNFKQDTLKLFTSQNLTIGKAYQFTISGIKNCVGIEVSNSIPTIGLPRFPQVGEIIINEVMAEPEPQVGLPIAEFIELYNTTNDLINISGFKIKDATATSNGKIAPNTTIKPKDYLILIAESNAQLFSEYGNIAIVSSFPSLNKTGDLIAIIDLNTITIDQINYKPDWYKSETKAEGGWSLERINPTQNCGGKYNWASSINANGGSPGSINSIFSTQADSAKPLITNVLLKSNKNVSIVFSEGMKDSNLPYAISIVGKNLESIGLSIPNDDTLNFKLLTPLDSGKIYTLQVQNLYDCSGNKIDYVSQTVGIGRKPKPYEVVINEIMADENPVQSLPEAEFVELFNTTTDLIDLGNFKLFDATTIPGKFPSAAIIQPNGYLILCSTSLVNDFRPYGNTLGITSFPSLNSSGDLINLKNPEGISISKIRYSDTWYRDEAKKDGGWSLEKIDPLNPCGTANNWIAAASETFGGTPGKINSNYASNPDNQPPKLTQAFATGKDSLLLYFNEPIDSVSAVVATYNISSEIGSSITNIVDDKIYLSLNTSLSANQQYTVSVSQLKDCVGNYIDASISKSFYLAEKADSFDLIINEVLFNPRTGGNDFVEIYNRSSKHINLKNWYLANVEKDTITNFKTITPENSLMSPKTYQVFTTNIQNIKNNYPNAVDSNFIQLENMPSYNDDEGTVVLTNPQFNTIDLFHYKDDFHLKLIDNKEGISLERINFNLPTNTPENWASAAQNAGFATPGFRNSQQSDFEISDKMVDITPKVFSPDQDGYLDFTTITFNTSAHNSIANITIFDLEGSLVRKLVRNQNIGNQSFFQWDGTDDLERKARIGNYLVYIEIFNLQGEVKSYKESVVVAGRF